MLLLWVFTYCIYEFHANEDECLKKVVCALKWKKHSAHFFLFDFQADCWYYESSMGAEFSKICVWYIIQKAYEISMLCIGCKLRLLNTMKSEEMQIGIAVQQISKGNYGSERLTFILLLSNERSCSRSRKKTQPLHHCYKWLSLAANFSKKFLRHFSF